jgi:protoporphyrinogen oxidase
MELSLDHLMRLIHIVLYTNYLSLAGGTASLHEALARRYRVRLETPASRLVEEAGKVVGVELEGSHEVIKADHVVVATVPPVAYRMVPESWKADCAFLSAIQIPAFSLPIFFLNRPLEKNVWSYLLHALPGKKIRYITDASRKNPEMVPSGNAVLQPWICYPDSADIADMSRDEIIALCTAEMEEVFPGFSSWIEDIHLVRHEYGVPFHSIGHVKKAVDFREKTDRRQISFCGDYLSGGYVESALWSAERAARVFG